MTMPLHAMIVARDELQNLAACISSLRTLTSDITVFDTGSVDATADLARHLDVQCRALPWKDDFSVARNAALQHWSSGWILVVDADERLSASSVPEIQQAIADASDDEDVFHLQVRTWTDDVEQLGYTGLTAFEANRYGVSGFVGTPEPRLFRAGRGMHYVGRIGERLCDAAGNAVQPVPWTRGVLQHLREEGSLERRRQRSRLHLGLALRQVLETGAPEASAQLGALLNSAGHWQRALVYLRDAEASHCPGVAVHMQAGVARLHLGLVDGAAASFRCAWEIAPGHPEVATWWARALLLQGGRLEQARELLEEAHAEAPELDLALVLLAHVHRRQGDVAAARAWLQALLENNPVHPLALKELGAVALLQSCPQEAERHLRQALRMCPHDVELLNNLGCALERLGLWDEALAAFSQGLLHSGNDVRLLRNRCVVQAACARHAQMIVDSECLLLLSPAPQEELLVLRERLLDGGWIAALEHLEEWAAGQGWTNEAGVLELEEPEEALEAI